MALFCDLIIMLYCFSIYWKNHDANAIVSQHSFVCCSNVAPRAWRNELLLIPVSRSGLKFRFSFSFAILVSNSLTWSSWFSVNSNSTFSLKSGLRSTCDRFGESFPIWLTDQAIEYNFFRLSGNFNACIASTLLQKGVNPNGVFLWPDHSVSCLVKWNLQKITRWFYCSLHKM